MCVKYGFENALDAFDVDLTKMFRMSKNWKTFVTGNLVATSTGYEGIWIEFDFYIQVVSYLRFIKDSFQSFVDFWYLARQGGAKLHPLLYTHFAKPRARHLLV